MNSRLIIIASMTSLLMALGVGCTSEKTVQNRQTSPQHPPTINIPGAGGEEAQSARCIGVEPTRTSDEPSVGEPSDEPTMPGSIKPNWTLRDVQPQSCGYDQHYGLDAFDGQPLLVVLLRGTCGFCHGQAVKLQQMHYELRAEGIDIHFVIVNEYLGENSYAEQFVERTYFPIFQDVEKVDAWGQMKGGKDDFYLYRSDGLLYAYLSFANDDDLALSAPEDESSGYVFLKRMLLDLVQNDESGDPIPQAAGTEGSGGQQPRLIDIGGEAGTSTETMGAGGAIAGGSDGQPDAAGRGEPGGDQSATSTGGQASADSSSAQGGRQAGQD